MAKNVKEPETPKTDQWKLDGNCGDCRKFSYCTKRCTAYKRHLMRTLQAIAQEKMKEKQAEEKRAQAMAVASDPVDEVSVHDNPEAHIPYDPNTKTDAVESNGK